VLVATLACAAILGSALHGDIIGADDLDLGTSGRQNRKTHLEDVLHHSVHPVPHPSTLSFPRLDCGVIARLELDGSARTAL